MQAYLDMVRNILENGEPKQPVRFDSNNNPVPVENGTIGVFGDVFRHNMKDGFPLLTTKRMSLKTIAVELEGFIKGIVSKQWYKDRKCNIWNEWANPMAVKTTLEDFSDHKLEGFGGWEPDNKEHIKKMQLVLDDLGPIYGYQWRSFNRSYSDNDDGCLNNYDQLKTVCDRLRENPYDRRMVVSAWNPIQINQMALPPCHYSFNIVVYGKTLNLAWSQRSCDVILGVPFNIASYALLLCLLARHANLEPGILQGELHDNHIYENQIEGTKEQLTREPRPLPDLTIPNNDGDSFDIFKWDHTQVKLENYDPHPSIKFEVTV